MCRDLQHSSSISSTCHRTLTGSPPCPTQVPCCNMSVYQEEKRMGRCAWYADRGECDKYGQWCPVACDVCAMCEGHPQRKAYLGVWKRMRHPPLSSTKRGSMIELNNMSSATAALQRVRIFAASSELREGDAWSIGRGGPG